VHGETVYARDLRPLSNRPIAVVCALVAGARGRVPALHPVAFCFHSDSEPDGDTVLLLYRSARSFLCCYPSYISIGTRARNHFSTVQ